MLFRQQVREAIILVVGQTQVRRQLREGPLMVAAHLTQKRGTFFRILESGAHVGKLLLHRGAHLRPHVVFGGYAKWIRLTRRENRCDRGSRGWRNGAGFQSRCC